jgi:hypothetical protein
MSRIATSMSFRRLRYSSNSSLHLRKISSCFETSRRSDMVNSIVVTGLKFPFFLHSTQTRCLINGSSSATNERFISCGAMRLDGPSTSCIVRFLQRSQLRSCDSDIRVPLSGDLLDYRAMAVMTCSVIIFTRASRSVPAGIVRLEGACKYPGNTGGASKALGSGSASL